MNIQEYNELYPHCNPYKKTKEEAIKYIKDKYKIYPREAEKQYRAFKKMWVLTPNEDDKEKHKIPKRTKDFKYTSFKEYAEHTRNYSLTMKVIELSKKDCGYKEIIEATGISTSQIQRIRQAAFNYGVLEKKKKVTPKNTWFNKEKFIEMYNDNCSYSEIAKEFNVSEATIFRKTQTLIKSKEIKKRERMYRNGYTNKNKKRH